MRSRRGQTAVPFIVFLGILLIFVGVTVNLGQVAIVRTETSNAADASALAAASWMASGNNEAAWIARKMWTAIALVQAIYTTPFCRTEDARTYARAVWNNLIMFNTYLRIVADRVLVGAWNLGRREAFTAAVNNMMIRYRTGRDLGDGAVIDGISRDLEENIRTLQQMYADQPSLADTPGSTLTFTWQTGPDEPGTLQHVAKYHIEGYPSAPAQLELTTWPESWEDAGFGYVWTDCRDVGSPGHPFYPCCHADSVGYQRGVPAEDLTAWVLPPAELNPQVRFGGAVITSGPDVGRKVWDVELSRVIPDPRLATIGSCGGVCELESLADWDDAFFAPQTVAPQAIVGGDGSVLVRMHHAVQAFDGIIEDPGGPVVPAPPELPRWRPRFRPIGSEATAQFTSANVGLWPERNAAAELTGAR